MSKTYLIGYCGKQDKWERIGWNAVIDCGKRNGLEFKHIDLSKSIEEQGNFDLIIHKLTYSMTNANDPEVENFKNYCAHHPSVKIIDPLDPVSITLDREKMADACNSIKYPPDLGFKVSVPKSIPIETNDPIQVNEAIKNIRFPVLAKPRLAGSSNDAHMLRLCTIPEHLKGIPTPTLLQEYINHGGVIYKAYALGDHLEVGCRRSTRDVEIGENLEIDFHSQHPSDPNGIWANPADLDKVQIPYEHFQKLSSILREQLNLQLIGFDILIDHDGVFWLVDINYFPGYKNIENLEEKFVHFFLQQLQKK